MRPIDVPTGERTRNPRFAVPESGLQRQQHVFNVILPILLLTPSIATRG
jgi:hypothetical protein